MPKEFDPRAWAQEQKAVQSGRRCMACQEPFRSTISTVLDEVIEGRAHSVSTDAICMMLEEQFGFTNSVSALRQHIRRHESERWDKIRKRL
jgi:Ni,Fe-hydrogenase I small subunit